MVAAKDSLSTRFFGNLGKLQGLLVLEAHGRETDQIIAIHNFPDVVPVVLHAVDVCYVDGA